MNCCWDEELKEYYEIESIGFDTYRCLGCYGKFKELAGEIQNE